MQSVFFIGGWLVLVFGITLTLLWWRDVVVLFRGFIGPGLALAGLVVLYLSRR